jgi:hypothetical protein
MKSFSGFRINGSRISDRNSRFRRLSRWSDASIAVGLMGGLILINVLPALALPSTEARPEQALEEVPEEIPEEVLRTEIITEARSPIDGRPLTAAEYAEIEAQQEEAEPAPEVDPEIRRLIGLLRLRQAIRSVFPFLIK